VDAHEILVEPGSACAEHRLRDLAWPANSVIASLQRGDQMIIPRGDTIIQPKDVLMVIADDPALQKIRLLCKEPKHK